MLKNRLDFNFHCYLNVISTGKANYLNAFNLTQICSENATVTVDNCTVLLNEYNFRVFFL